MDIYQAQEMVKLADELIKVSRMYEDSRDKAGKAKSSLDIILSTKLDIIRESKPNIGYDMAMLMLINLDISCREMYKEMIEETSKYKGLERIIEALKTKISLGQSVMKYQVQNDGGGL